MAIPCSTYGREAIQALDSKLNPSVVRLGVDSDFWKVASEHRVIIGDGPHAKEISRENTFLIFWAGVNSNRKNLDALLQAAAPVLKAHEDAYLLLNVAYENPTGIDIFAVARRLGIPEAQFAVNRGPEDRSGVDDGMLRQYYAISTITACTSIGEGNWLPGYEAQACGSIPVGIDFSAVRETIGSRGVLVRASYTGAIGEFGYVRGLIDIEALTEAVEGLYDDWKNCKSQRIEEMRGRGRKWAEFQNWDRFTDAVTKLITTEKDVSQQPAKARTWVKQKVNLAGLSVGMCCPTFKQNCGIGHYSEALVDSLFDSGVHLKTYATKEPQRLADAAVEQELDLVHLQHEYSFYDVEKLQVFYRGLSEAGIASVTTMHTVVKDEFTTRPVLEGSGAVIVHSERARDVLLGMAPDAENIHVMPMGAPFAQLRSRKRLRALQGFHENDFVIGSYGFLRDQKGYDILLNTVVRMEASVKLFIFASEHLFGSADYDENFMKTVEDMGLEDRVTLYREQITSKADVVNLLSIADVLVLAYRDNEDAFGISSAAKDCAAAGRPMILSDSPAFSDFEEGAAISVPQNDHEPIIEAVQKLRGDEVLRTELGHAARSHAWEHRWDRVGQLHADFYQSLLEGSE